MQGDSAKLMGIFQRTEYSGCVQQRTGVWQGYEQSQRVLAILAAVRQVSITEPTYYCIRSGVICLLCSAMAAVYAPQKEAFLYLLSEHWLLGKTAAVAAYVCCNNVVQVSCCAGRATHACTGESTSATHL